ncbi:MAG: hypothetical protein JNK72_21525 [Myxococcales bacterium]|nr:hypothetical protein [Myxococcales bacterium]
MQPENSASVDVLSGRFVRNVAHASRHAQSEFRGSGALELASTGLTLRGGRFSAKRLHTALLAGIALLAAGLVGLGLAGQVTLVPMGLIAGGLLIWAAVKRAAPVLPVSLVYPWSDVANPVVSGDAIEFELQEGKTRYLVRFEVPGATVLSLRPVVQGMRRAIDAGALTAAAGPP